MQLVSHPSCLWARKLLNFSILSQGTLSGWHGFHKLPIPSLEGGGIAGEGGGGMGPRVYRSRKRRVAKGGEKRKGGGS